MAVPVLLIAGFLGSGKTTLLNRLLTHPGGRRIAAVVNDFGAIGIDAALLREVSGDVVSLENGCICCALQGDLLRTLAAVMRREPAPDMIVIETSGVSDPAGIVRSLLDPFIFRAAALDAVITLVDAAYLAERRELSRDPLWLSQVRSADFVILNKVDLIDAATRAELHGELLRWKPERAIFDAVRSAIPDELLFSAERPERTAPPSRSPAAPPRFETLSWISPHALSMPGFSEIVSPLATKLVRAKGILTFREKPSQRMLFQLAGSRAAIIPCGVKLEAGVAANLVMIGEGLEAERAFVWRLLESVSPPPIPCS
jgi:cobalamin biosynthesis protein CobW